MESAFDMFQSFRDGNKRNRKGITCMVEDGRLISRRYEKALTAAERADSVANNQTRRVWISPNIAIDENYGPYIYAVYTKGGNLIANGDALPPRIRVQIENAFNTAGRLGHNQLQLSVFKAVPKISFVCLEEAGIHPQSIEVIDTTPDLSYGYSDEKFTVRNVNGDLPSATSRVTILESASVDDVLDYLRKNGLMPTEVCRTCSSGKGLYLCDGDLVKLMSQDYTLEEGCKITDIKAHSLGSVVFRHNGCYFLAARDERAYFIVELPVAVVTVEEAFNALRPKEVLDAMKEGKVILRQGEWFFIKLDEIPEGMMQAEADSLPQKRAGSSAHVCSIAYGEGRTLICTGTVKHLRWERLMKGFARTGEHADLTLAPNYYLAYENTALQSWSVSGLGVD